MFQQFPVAIVAGLSATTRAIGRENGLLWHVPDDMKRFKTLTLGKPVIMGRKTFESIVAILGKPLPGRTNIVITRNLEYFYPGAITATNLEEAFEIAVSRNVRNWKYIHAILARWKENGKDERRDSKEVSGGKSGQDQLAIGN